jgi:hypothetical protein
LLLYLKLVREPTIRIKLAGLLIGRLVQTTEETTQLITNTGNALARLAE